MLSFKRKFSLFCVLPLVFLVASCNSVTKKKMDHFITGKIQTIEKDQKGYSIVLETALDSVVLSAAFNEDFENNMAQFGLLEVGQEISIKGDLFCPDSCLLIIKQIKK